MRAMLLCALLLANEAYALRCGSDLVLIRDYKWDVLHKCGEPDYVDRYTVMVLRPLPRPIDIPSDVQILSTLVPTEVQVEEWVYNFGPRKFQQLLEFEDNVLVRIQQLHYGH
ncbi:MAG: DUF2845 domain-containing protein [Methylomonas sp.]